MNNKNIYAPQLDNLIKRASDNPNAHDEATVNQALRLIEKLKQIEICGNDECREIWLCAERGTISDFGDYNEYLDYGEVENQDEFQELWEHYYPDEMKWYKLTVTSYKDVHYIRQSRVEIKSKE